MLNYQDTNTDTLVQRAGQLPPGVQGFSLPRGNVSFGVQFCAGNALTDAPTGTTAVWFGLKGTADMKGPWLANVQLLPIAGSPGLYRAVLPCNTPEMIAATHADPADTEPELVALPVYGQVYYFLPGVADPNTSQLINVTITPVLWNGLEGIAPSPNPAWPTAAAVTAALAQAAAAAASEYLPHVRFLSLGGAGGVPPNNLLHVATDTRSVGDVVSFRLSVTPNQLTFASLATGAPDAGDATQIACNDDETRHWQLLTITPAADSGGSGSSFTLHPPATNDDKRALTGVNAGDHAQVTGEGNRLEQFVPVVAVLLVSGAGDAGANGTYLPTSSIGSGTTASYAQVANPDYRIDGYPGNWSLSATQAERTTEYSSTGAEPMTNAWTVEAGGTSPAPTVTRNDVASDSNWIVLRNTVSLCIVNAGYADLAVNGVTVLAAYNGTGGGGSPTNIGWVDPDRVSISPDPDGIDFGILTTITDTHFVNPIAGPFAPSVKYIAPDHQFAILAKCLPRQQDLALRVDGGGPG